MNRLGRQFSWLCILHLRFNKLQSQHHNELLQAVPTNVEAPRVSTSQLGQELRKFLAVNHGIKRDVFLRWRLSHSMRVQKQDASRRISEYATGNQHKVVEDGPCRKRYSCYKYCGFFSDECGPTTGLDGYYGQPGAPERQHARKLGVGYLTGTLLRFCCAIASAHRNCG